ncbi:MAG: SDR family NAD(P)-dependent oxidoreductase, partial [Thermaerobacter sp.]|nr:SDR family NAD(P)-dependent oxidoreductase [Thermaerobacter sp.]
MAIAIDLTDRTALITGAAKGLGRTMVHTLMAAGARVVATDINDEELRSVGIPASSRLHLDVGNSESVQQAFT